MENQHHQPDAAIDKTLAALNSAAPPEGLESRIAARIAAQPAPAVSPWRDRFTGYTLASAWWRGAAAGAAVAMLAVTAVLLLQHKTFSPNRIAVATPVHAPAITPVSFAASATPCALPAVLHPRTPAAPATEIASSSHPIPSSPLTSQERALVRLAQTADPKVLATFNSEHQEQLEAENAAQFEKFFTPPARPPVPPDTPAANPEASPANPDASPQATPETAPFSRTRNQPSRP